MYETKKDKRLRRLAKENRLRRLAKQKGFILRKSRVKYISADNYGDYMILDRYSGNIVAGERWNLDLDDVEDFLTQEDE